MRYLNWKVIFHVHIEYSSIYLGVILVQPGKGNLDYPIYFSTRNISEVDYDYITIEREGLEMAYTLKKFRHYLLGGHFKFFTDHSNLKYLVNKPMLEGRIFRWLSSLEFSFEVIFKLGK
jgi:hypothetical protein